MVLARGRYPEQLSSFSRDFTPHQREYLSNNLSNRIEEGLEQCNSVYFSCTLKLGTVQVVVVATYVRGKTVTVTAVSLDSYKSKLKERRHLLKKIYLRGKVWVREHVCICMYNAITFTRSEIILRSV